VDRFLAIYLALAGSPFVLYAALLKQGVASRGFVDLPPVVSAALIFIAFAGYGILKVVTQLRFSTLLYVRAMNGIRRAYGGADAHTVGLLLPADSQYPPYNEGPQGFKENGKLNRRAGKYMFEIMVLMAVANAGYLGLGVFYFPRVVPWQRSMGDYIGPGLIVVVFLVIELAYYFRSANQREVRGRVPGKI
jgi:hypothetical protein